MSKKRNILYIGGFDLPDNNAAAHRVITNGKLFEKLGYSINFISVSKEVDSNITQVSENTWTRKYPKGLLDWTMYLTSAKDMIRIIKKIDNLELVVCYNLQAIPLLKVINYCNKYSIKVISDCTEWYTTKNSSLLFKILKGTDSFLRMRIFQKKCDGIICISEYLKNYYKKHNTILLPPLIDKNEEKWQRERHIIKIGNRRTYTFTFAGTVGRNKDDVNSIVKLLEKVKRNHNIELNLIGISEQDYIDLYGYLTDFEREFIVFHGKKNHRETLELLKETDYTIFLRENNLSNLAGFPTKFVESYSLGIPIITNVRTNLEKYIKEGTNGVFINEENGVSEINNLLNEQKQINKEDTYTFHFELFENEMKLFLQNVMGDGKK